MFHEINGRNLMEIPKDFEIIILGMGCFWGAEKFFGNLMGFIIHQLGMLVVILKIQPMMKFVVG